MTGVEPAVIGGKLAADTVVTSAVVGEVASGISVSLLAPPTLAAPTTTGLLAGVTMFDAFMLGSTALSTVGGLMSAQNQAAHQDNMMAFNQSVEGMEAAKREALRQEELGNVLAAQRVMFGGAGLDVSTGSPLNVAEQAVKQAERETNIDRDLAAINSMGAAMKRKSASSSMNANTLGVLGGAGENILDWAMTRKRLG